MTIDSIDVDGTVRRVRELMKQEENMSPALSAILDVLLVLVVAMLNRLTLTSKNSSKPPSQDSTKSRPSKKKRDPNGNKPGGQKGHIGTTLEPFSDPDEVLVIEIDRSTLPEGIYREVGYDQRQVIDIDISRIITEYRAQILENEKGERFVATFPNKVTRPAQYGVSVKSHAVYISQFQLIPYNRVEDYFRNETNIPISAGSIFNFNKEAFLLLEPFEQWLKIHLLNSSVLNADETGIKIGTKGHWLHCLSNEGATWFYPHSKRGTEAMDEMGVLPNFKGKLCHDHWKPYYRYDGCIHCLCNAHHLRELERAWEQDHQQWAKQMQELLLKINENVNGAGGMLEPKIAAEYRDRYQCLLKEADKECPPPDESQRKGKRGRIKRSKARNLLERLRNFENDTLRFMEDKLVPFTNNQGENDIRMTKVQQKISGCFRSYEGAAIFCRIRSYISTCRKKGVSASDALDLLFKGEWPEFMQSDAAE
jgi:transposase